MHMQDLGTVIEGKAKFGMPIPCGLLTQSKAIPIRYMNLTIELEVVDNFADALMENSALSGATGQSNNRHIENVSINGDTMTLDGSLDNEVTRHLTSGKPLSLQLCSWFTSKHTVSQNWSIALTRAFTRIRGVYVSMLDASADKEPKSWE